MKLSRENLGRSAALNRSITKVNQHCFVFNYTKDFHIPNSRPREWVLKCIWKWHDEHTLVVTYQSVDHQDFPESSCVMRASNTVYIVYKKVPVAAGGLQLTASTWTQQVRGGVRISSQHYAHC